MRCSAVMEPRRARMLVMVRVVGGRGTKSSEGISDVPRGLPVEAVDR